MLPGVTVVMRMCPVVFYGATEGGLRGFAADIDRESAVHGAQTKLHRLEETDRKPCRKNTCEQPQH